MRNTKWTREETILAFGLYCKTPFGKIHQDYPDIIELSKVIGRTSSAVAMKMCNFASFDPELKARGVNGLSNASKLDKQIWNEFNDNWDKLIYENEQTQARLYGKNVEELVDLSDLPQLPEGKTKEQIIKARINQSFFRKAIMSAYKNTCCITGIKIPELLVASHIKPWKDADPKTERLSPTNGLLLNTFHDKAFDKGLITINNKYQIVVSNIIKQNYTDDVYDTWIFGLEGKLIELPERFIPEKKFIEFHNDVVFLHN